jgi:hypothetical protein
MFLVDNLLNKVLDVIKDEIVDRRDVSRETIAHARSAMRRLAASLSETVEYLEGGFHTLNRNAGNRKSFSQALSNLIDQEHLQRNCSESGVCEDLRLAQDELRQLPRAIKLPKSKKTINDLINQIDGYEREFVRAVREFLATSREFDLTALHDKEVFDPKLVLETLTRRIEELKSTVQKIDDVIDALRGNPT